MEKVKLFLGKYSQHVNLNPIVFFKIPIGNLASASNILAGLEADLGVRVGLSG